ncbi:MAG: prepilin peptidase [Bacilli bacterium]|nr:prepilin peptidase [Bacilli bacterium]
MDIFIIVCLGVFGAILGSFLGCMGYRIPNKIKTTYPSSFCSSCKKPLKWYMNIPLISYIVQGGKCAYCKENIGFIYFLTELLGASLFILNYCMFRFNIEFFIATILVCVLIVTIVSDFKYYYISDRVLIISIICLLVTFFVFLNMTDVINRIVSAIIIFLLMYGIKILGNSMFNQESLGDGDIKLMGVIGLALGWLNSLVSLVFASILGLIFSIITIKRNKEGIIPFGPFLIIGALLVVYLSPVISPYLQSLIS